MPPIRMGFEPQNPQNVAVLLEMGSFLNPNKNFSRYLFLSLHFVGLSFEDLFVATLSPINTLTVK